MSLFVENLRILKTVSFESISSIQQHFWDLSTQRILTVLKESFQSRKALLKVRKLSLLLHGHNSYSVWEWKTVIYKGIFVDWRSSRIFFFFLFFFLHAYYLAFFLKRCISTEMEQKKSLRVLKPLGGGKRELTCLSELQTSCYICSPMPTSRHHDGSLGVR